MVPELSNLSSPRQATRGGGVWLTFALPEEAGPFRSRTRGWAGVDVLLTGMGKAKAGQAVASALQGGRPSCIISSGFAGALSPRLMLGDVVFEADRSFPLQCGLVQAGAKPVAFTCADRIASTVSEKAALRASTGADAVEMESTAIRKACADAGVPMLTVRVISDEADEDLPVDFNRFVRPDQTLAIGALLREVACSPRLIPRLLTFKRRTRRAAVKLGDFLAAFLASAEVSAFRSTTPTPPPSR